MREFVTAIVVLVACAMFARADTKPAPVAPKATVAPCGPLGCPIVRRSLSLSVERVANAFPVAHAVHGRLRAFLVGSCVGARGILVRVVHRVRCR